MVQAVERPYQTGKIVDVQRKVDTRILYNLVNTPVTEDDPYYEISVQLGSTVYRGLNRPRTKADTLPQDWKPGVEVQVKVEGRHFYVKGPNGSDWEFAIAKRIAATPPASK